MNVDKDIISLLPVQVSSHILSFLDARSLLACSRVNEDWNEITNQLLPKVWSQACVEAGFLVSKEKYDNARDWKAFLSSMIQRQSDIQTCECFKIVRRHAQKELTAIYYHNGKIAVAYLGGIQVWAFPGDYLYVQFSCDFQATFLKFDDNIILWGSTDGHVSLGCMRSGRLFGNYSNVEEMPTSFDFLHDYEMVVYSFIEKRFFIPGVCIRSLSQHQLVRRLKLEPLSIIVRVMLAPFPGHAATEQQKEYYLFCQALDYISMLVLTFQSASISHRFVTGHKFDIPFQVRTTSDIIYKPPGGLRFDGRNLYIITPPLPAANRGILRWDLTTDEKVFTEDNQIVSLLGVGQMYAADEIKTGENTRCIRISHKISHEILTNILLPRRMWTNADFLCLGETSWLDGLNGANDRGVVGAFLSDDRLSVNFITFLPRRQ